MLKNFFKKINNVIQWSKKYHFFHILAIPSFLFVANPFWLFFDIFITGEDDFIGYSIFEGFCLLVIYVYLYSLIIFFIFYFIYKKFGQSETDKVTFDSLLNSKFYNVYYIFSSIITALLVIMLPIAIIYIIICEYNY